MTGPGRSLVRSIKLAASEKLSVLANMIRHDIDAMMFVNMSWEMTSRRFLVLVKYIEFLPCRGIGDATIMPHSSTGSPLRTSFMRVKSCAVVRGYND